MWQSDYVIMWGRNGCVPSHSHWLSNPPPSVLGLFPIPSTRLPLQWGRHPQTESLLNSVMRGPGRRLESEGSQKPKFCPPSPSILASTSDRSCVTRMAPAALARPSKVPASHLPWPLGFLPLFLLPRDDRRFLLLLWVSRLPHLPLNGFSTLPSLL